ncbi:MAG: hypothetical protein JWR62_1811 [Modestobacter sp.]|jgi:hypothetical protein|nr:hypothetical protein [Modestobacter sp.]
MAPVVVVVVLLHTADLGLFPLAVELVVVVAVAAATRSDRARCIGEITIPSPGTRRLQDRVSRVA